MTDSNNEAEKEQKQDIPTISVGELERDELRRQADEYKDKYFHLLAESENARKRLQKERQEHTQYALSGVIADFLEPIDQMEIALKHSEKMSEEVKHWGIGFKMILSQFKDILSNNGVFTYDSMGKTSISTTTKRSKI